MEFETIVFEKQDGVATITLNRPERMNAVSDRMKVELSEAIADVESDDSVRVLVLTGAGRAFCAGGDLGRDFYDTTHPREAMQVMSTAGKIILSLRNLPKPVIAAVNGAAVAMGLGLALACDIIIASDKARFGHVYVSIGSQSDCGTIYFLPRLIGVAKACELIFTGEIIDAKEAERIGLVNRVVPAEELESAAKELALRLAKGPPVAIGLAKTALYQALEMSLSEALELEARGHALAMLTEDMREGVKAFKEKREAQFKGR